MFTVYISDFFHTARESGKSYMKCICSVFWPLNKVEP